MDVDDATEPRREEAFSEYAHVAAADDQFHLVRIEHGVDRILVRMPPSGRIIEVGSGRKWNYFCCNLEAGGALKTLDVGLVGDHDHRHVGATS
jgi:hypothetical protein